MLIKKVFLRIVTISLSVLFLCLLLTSETPAQSTSEPKVSHKACVTHCVMDQTVLRSSMGDTQARNAYHGWFDSYYELTGCSQSAFRNVLEFALDIIGDVVDAGGGTTMQCWQGLLAQADLCSDACSDYFIPNAKYGPNVRVMLDGGVPGSLAVTLSNNDYGYMPEETPNAYSLKFYLDTFIQLDGGTQLMVDHTFMPSMSYSNWVTRGGMDDCIRAYGTDAERCNLLEGFNMPDSIPAAVEFMDGAFYDLTDYVKKSSGKSGSFSNDGFVVLKSDGNSVTIKQGPFSGYAWTKYHNISTGEHSRRLTYWDASLADVKISNKECNNALCGLFGDQTDADTYVFALQGPPEYRLAGTYTVQVVADVVHDKNFSNNRVSYSYSEAEVGNTLDTTDSDETPEEETIPISDLPVIDLPGEGVYPYTLPDDLPGLMFRVSIPEEAEFVYIQLVSQDGGNFMFYGRIASIPVPDYPRCWSGSYSCSGQSDANSSHGCPFNATSAFDYYFFVPTYGTGRQFQLDVSWSTEQEVTATQSARQTEQALATQENTIHYTEVEPNDSRANANIWDMSEPFTGQLDWGNMDQVRLDIQTSGIYTFTISDVSPNLQVKVNVGKNGSTFDSVTAPARGEPVSYTMDASAGEQYYLSIMVRTMDDYDLTEPYQLALTGFIPDLDESNDEISEATFWDITQGPKQGYFWDKVHGRADYFKIIAPQTQDNSPVTFTVTNPGADLRIRMKLLNYTGAFLEDTLRSAPGEDNSLVFNLEAGQQYYLMLEVSDLKTSFDPYELSIDYLEANDEPEVVDSGVPIRFKGFVYQTWGPVPLPISQVEIYAQISGGAPFLLDTTGFFGTYSALINLTEGQEVRIWPVLPGTNFDPVEDIYYLDLRERGHRANFIASGGQVLQETPSEEDWNNQTPVPPLIETALASLTAEETKEKIEATSTPTPSITPTPTPTITPTPTPSPNPSQMVTISGTVWRLFNSGPAGVAMAEVILSVNGVDQPAALSMIDGSYEIVVNVQPGDALELRAQSNEDDFEPIYYSWSAEAGVNQWNYEFYSYWEEIIPPEDLYLNRIYGTILDSNGQGMPGMYLDLIVGRSDAIQRLGPTDAFGYFEAIVPLPNWVMVTVLVDAPGMLPSRILFFHAYASENREINFWQSGSD